MFPQKLQIGHFKHSDDCTLNSRVPRRCQQRPVMFTEETRYITRQQSKQPISITVATESAVKERSCGCFHRISRDFGRKQRGQIQWDKDSSRRKPEEAGVATVVGHEEVRQCCTEPRAISSRTRSSSLCLSFLLSREFGSAIVRKTVRGDTSRAFPTFLDRSPRKLSVDRWGSFDARWSKNRRKTGQERSDRRAGLDVEEEEEERSWATPPRRATTPKVSQSLPLGDHVGRDQVDTLLLCKRVYVAWTVPSDASRTDLEGWDR